MAQVKTVMGTARRTEDVKRIYEAAVGRAHFKGRMTDTARKYIGTINEIFDGIGIEKVPLNVVVEYIREADGNYETAKERQALSNSIRGFLKNPIGKQNFDTFKDEEEGLIIVKRED